MLLSKQIMSIPFKPIHYLQKWYNLICLRKVNHLKTGNNEDDSKKLPGETQAAELPLFDLTKDANRVIVSRLLQSVQLSWITSMFVIICLWTLFGARFCLILVLAFHLVSSLFRRSNKLRFEWSNRKRAAAATRIEADLWIQLHRQFPWASLLIGPTQAKQHRQCINQVLHKLWPQIRRNVLESFRVRKLGLGFQCAKIDLGRNAPTIQRLRVNTSKWNDGRWARNNFGDQLSLQLDCDWQAGVGQRLSIKWLFGLWHVKRFSCAFTLYIVMRFRSRNVGGEWIATRISLERAPHWFEYQTEGILLMAMDFFGMLSPFVQMLCSTLLVEPNHVLIQNPKFTNQPQEADESMNDYCLPSGLLQVRQHLTFHFLSFHV